MKRIRIIATPPGFAPEEIRKEWVGIEIPVNREEINKLLLEPGVWSGNTSDPGYAVLAGDAIHALETAGKHEAAEFWRGIPSSVYKFKADVCEVVES